MIKLIKTPQYKYLISIKTDHSTGSNYCKWPKEKPSYGSIRGFSRIYLSDDGSIKKEIIYPQELWFTEVKKTDTIEHDLIDIKNDWPSWYLIKIFE